ncbi:MAG: ATP-binding cassette domain-containing protein [Jeotgalicoccus sp.]
MLHIKKLCINYGSFSADVKNIEFGPGIHVLLGENGSGKSSVLTGITGYNMSVITERELEVNNTPIDKTADYISYLPQQNVPFQITVEDFIKMTADSRPAQKDVRQTLQKFGLEKFRLSSADSLSGGEFKRALCAQVHLEGKSVMMFDEIEQGLDINYQHLVMAWLKDLSRDKVIIMAMHDLNLALRYADTVTCMKKGTLTEVKVPVTEVNERMLADTFSREMKIIHFEGKVIAVS